MIRINYLEELDGEKMNLTPAANPLYVEKRVHLVHMYLTSGVQIKGSLHVAPRIRLTDTLNFQSKDKPFLPVTNAQIIFQNGEEVSVPFLVVNRQNIICGLPQEKVVETSSVPSSVER